MADQWQWKRPGLQGRKLGIKGYCRPKNVIKWIHDVLQLCGDHSVQLFRESCFGHFLDLDTGYGTPSALHQLMCQEVEIPGSDRYTRWFRVSDQNLSFTRMDFMRVLGLCFEDRGEFDPNGEVEIGSGSLYARMGLARVSVDDLRSRFVAHKFGAEDAVKVAKILLVYYFLLGQDTSKVYVDPWIWALVEDTKGWDRFPWGKISYITFLHHLDSVITSVRPRVNSDGQRYNFYGCSFALVVWAYERITGFAEPFTHGSPNRDIRPLCLRWKYKTSKHDTKKFFSKCPIVLDLPAVLSDETCSNYWQGINNDLESGFRVLFYKFGGPNPRRKGKKKLVCSTSGSDADDTHVGSLDKPGQDDMQHDVEVTSDYAGHVVGYEPINVEVAYGTTREHSPIVPFQPDIYSGSGLKDLASKRRDCIALERLDADGALGASTSLAPPSLASHSHHSNHSPSEHDHHSPHFSSQHGSLLDLVPVPVSSLPDAHRVSQGALYRDDDDPSRGAHHSPRGSHQEAQQPPETSPHSSHHGQVRSGAEYKRRNVSGSATPRSWGATGEQWDRMMRRLDDHDQMFFNIETNLAQLSDQGTSLQDRHSAWETRFDAIEARLAEIRAHQIEHADDARKAATWMGASWSKLQPRYEQAVIWTAYHLWLKRFNSLPPDPTAFSPLVPPYTLPESQPDMSSAATFFSEELAATSQVRPRPSTWFGGSESITPAPTTDRQSPECPKYEGTNATMFSLDHSAPHRLIRERHCGTACQSPYTKVEQQKITKMWKKFMNSEVQIDIGLRHLVGNEFFVKIESPKVWLEEHHIDACLRLLAEAPGYVQAWPQKSNGSYAILPMEFCMTINSVWDEYIKTRTDNTSCSAEVPEDQLAMLDQFWNGKHNTWQYPDSTLGTTEWHRLDRLLFVVHSCGHYYATCVYLRSMKMAIFDSLFHKWDAYGVIEENRKISTLPYRRLIPLMMHRSGAVRDVPDQKIRHTLKWARPLSHMCYQQEDSWCCGQASVRTIHYLLNGDNNWMADPNLIAYRKKWARDIFSYHVVSKRIPAAADLE